MIISNIGSYPLYTFTNAALVDKILPKVKNLHYESVYSHKENNNPSQLGYEKTDDFFSSFYDEELYSWLENCAQQILEKHFNNKDTNIKLKICDLWATKSSFGQYAHRHRHPFSFFSGLYYMNDCDRSETCFYYEDVVYDHWKYFLGPRGKNNTQKVKIKPEKGKLIMWPSMLEHAISTHTGKENRYTLAFNTMFNGIIEDPTSRLELKVTELKDQKFKYT